VVATLLEETVRMSVLKIAAANFLAWNLCGNSEDGNTAAYIGPTLIPAIA
jgi:hypothetical protein